MTILLVTDFHAEELAQWIDCLQAELPDETFLTEADRSARASVDIALVANPPRGALEHLPRLALIQSLWAGVDRLLADPTVPDRVPLARMVDPAMSQAMAETALWAVLAIQRGFFTYAGQQRHQVWQPHAQRRADETPVAVLGLGDMGRSVAERLAANGYPVTGWSRTAATLAGVPQPHGSAALGGVLAGAQVVVNLLPLTAQTAGLLDARAFAAMRRGAGLVNLGRGAHVVDADLLAALDAGQIGHAVLDVFQAEPLPAEHRYWRHERVTVLPHVAAQTDPRSAAARAADNIRRQRCGQPLRWVVERQRAY